MGGQQGLHTPTQVTGEGGLPASLPKEGGKKEGEVTLSR